MEQQNDEKVEGNSKKVEGNIYIYARKLDKDTVYKK